jgi:hypothetical protein
MLRFHAWAEGSIAASRCWAPPALASDLTAAGPRLQAELGGRAWLVEARTRPVHHREDNRAPLVWFDIELLAGPLAVFIDLQDELAAWEDRRGRFEAVRRLAAGADLSFVPGVSRSWVCWFQSRRPRGCG